MGRSKMFLNETQHPKRNSYYAVLVAFLILWHRGLYLLPSSFLGMDRDDFLFIGGVILFLAYVIEAIKEGMVLPKTRYFIQFVAIFGLISVASLMASVTTSQGILRGFINQMGWISVALSYFLLSKWIVRGKLCYEDIERAIIVVALFESLLSIVQFYIVGTSHLFLNVKTNERYETARLYINNAYILFSLSFLSRRLAKGVDVSKTIVLLISLFIPVVTIIKSRIGIIAAIFVIAGTYVFSKIESSPRTKSNEVTMRKQILRGAILLFGVVLLYQASRLNLVQDFINAINNPITDRSSMDRMNAISFYMEKWASSPFTKIFGYGYTTKEMSLYRYILADNGIFGFLFVYGLVGLIWLVVFAFRTIKDGWLIRKKSGNAGLFIMAITNYIGLSVTYYLGYYFVYSLLLVLLIEAEIIEERNVEL